VWSCLINLKHEPAGPARIEGRATANAFSFCHWSRLDIHLASGSVFDCEELRDGCPGMVADDGFPGTYSYLALDTRPPTARAARL